MTLPAGVTRPRYLGCRCAGDMVGAHHPFPQTRWDTVGGLLGYQYANTRYRRRADQELPDAVARFCSIPADPRDGAAD